MSQSTLPKHDTSDMALLQISEPGQTPAPHQRRIAIGIDLGTTHSLVASVRQGGSACLPAAERRALLTYTDADLAAFRFPLPVA